MPALLTAAFLVTTAQPCRAVVVRGKVTSPLGQPLAGARVQLIQGQRSVADGITGQDGTYEIRTSFAGRFLILTAPSVFAADYAPQVGMPFYAGRADVLTIDVALNHAGITPQITQDGTLVERPVRQLASAPAQVAADQLSTHTDLVPELRVVPGLIHLGRREAGLPELLFVRGAPPATLHTVVDGIEANPLGEAFDLSTLSATGFSSVSPQPAVEVLYGGNPLFGTGASGGVLDLKPATGEALRPTLTYTGAAGNLGAYRNEAVATWARSRVDLLAAFGRFDIANEPPAEAFHVASYALNLGYHISASSSLRLAARQDVSASGLPNPYQLFLVTPKGRVAHQNLFAAATFETRSTSGWHNLIRFGSARERGETFDYLTPASGRAVTLTGANGFKASGTANLISLPRREDTVTNRDEAGWQSDYEVRPWLGLVGAIRYRQERAADLLPANRETLTRDHISAALGLSGNVKHRFFYEGSGLLDRNETLGLMGSPRLGLTYVPVRPGLRKLRGTALHATAATGFREPSLREQAANPEVFTTPRSRTFEASVDQNILGEKLTLRGSYFHSQCSHEFEPVALTPGQPYRPLLRQTLALRTQGAELDLRYQPYQRVLLEAGYDYLAAYTERSSAVASVNPALPGLPIGALTALAGQRPFHRPPQSGIFLAEYSGARLNAAIQGTLVAKSDDSTNLIQSPGLLLPNRNLSPGYVSMDAHLSAVLSRRVTFIGELENLTGNRHIAPIGYLSNPFLLETGVRVRIGRE